MASAWSCRHAEGLAIVRSLGPADFYRWWSDGGARHTAWPLPGGATQGRPAHLHAPPWAWPGTTCPHPVECTGQPGFTAGAYPDVPSVIPGVCRAVATAGSGQASGLCGRGWESPTVSHHPVRPLLVACRSVPNVLAGRAFPFQLWSCAGWSGRGGCPVVLHSPGVAGPWWRHSPVRLGRCRSDRPNFFWPRW